MTHLSLPLFFLVALGGSPLQAADIKAGPIWNNGDSQIKCPVACTAVGGEWNGNWHTTIWTKMSVCSCDNVKPADCTPLTTSSTMPGRLYDRRGG